MGGETLSIMHGKRTPSIAEVPVQATMREISNHTGIGIQRKHAPYKTLAGRLPETCKAPHLKITSPIFAQYRAQ